MIAFFVISTHLGGAERSLLDLLREFKHKDRKMIVVVPKNEGPLLDILDKEEIPWVVLSLPTWLLDVSRKHKINFLLKTPWLFFHFFSFHKKLKKWTEDNSIQVIHSTGLKFHFLLGISKKMGLKTPTILHIRDIIKNPAIKKALLWINKGNEIYWISNSQVTAQSIAPISSDVIYNGFYPLKYNKEGVINFHWEQFGIPDDKPLIGIVAVIARWKGQREFIEMAHRLTQQGLDYHYAVIGDVIYDTSGERGEKEELLDLVKQYQLNDRVHFLGFQKKIEPIYQRLNALVHASIQPEPFGRVIVEAMMSGCPVTASQAGGPLEIIEPGVDGLLHPPGDTEQMALNVHKIISDPSFAHQIQTQAILSSKQFSIETHSQKIWQIMAPFLNNK